MAINSVSDVLLVVISRELSDKSIVYDVQLGALQIPAFTKTDAEDLAGEIADAINEHSTYSADVLVE